MLERLEDFKNTFRGFHWERTYICFGAISVKYFFKHGNVYYFTLVGTNCQLFLFSPDLLQIYPALYCNAKLFKSFLACCGLRFLVLHPFYAGSHVLTLHHVTEVQQQLIVMRSFYSKRRRYRESHVPFLRMIEVQLIGWRSFYSTWRRYRGSHVPFLRMTEVQLIVMRSFYHMTKV